MSEPELMYENPLFDLLMEFLQKAIKEKDIIDRAKESLTFSIKTEDGNCLHLQLKHTILTPTEET